MGRLIALLLLSLIVSTCSAGVFVCSKVYPPFLSSMDKTDRYGKIKRTYYQITRNDLIQAYSGKPVFINDAWLTVVILPFDSFNTISAYADLQVDRSILSSATDYIPLIDLSVRVVRTEDQMIDAILSNPPAVGYETVYSGRNGPAPCFP